MRDQLQETGLRVWQQATSIPKDSDNWFTEWWAFQKSFEHPQRTNGQFKLGCLFVPVQVPRRARCQARRMLRERRVRLPIFPMPRGAADAVRVLLQLREESVLHERIHRGGKCSVQSSLFGFSQTKTDRNLFAQQTNNKLLVVVCENIGKITAVDPKDFPHASNALAHFGPLTRPPPNRTLCN